MRLHILFGSCAIVIASGCGQSATDQPAPSAQNEVLPDLAVERDPSAHRALSRELSDDDPVFRAATDAYEPGELEQRMMGLTGLTSNDLGVGYFGQRFSVSLWAPVPDVVAMDVCDELVAYANEIDFPATEIIVRQKSYSDFEWSQELAAVDATGFCVPSPA